MARLTAAQRKALPASAFVYPGRRAYPIHDPTHARNALARAAMASTRGSEATVRRAVKRRYGSRIGA